MESIGVIESLHSLCPQCHNVIVSALLEVGAYCSTTGRSHTVLIRMDDFSLFIFGDCSNQDVEHNPLVFHHFLLSVVKLTHVALDPVNCDLALAI